MAEPTFPATSEGSEPAAPTTSAGAEPAPTGAPPIVTPTTATDRVRERARSAWSFGIIAMSLAMTGMCFTYIPFLLAIPIALVGLSQAREALGNPDLDDAGKVYGRTAQILSTIALSFSTLVLVLIVTFMVLYVGFLASIFGLAASLPPPPPPVPTVP